MISLVAGRIVPAFTGNWLKVNNPGRMPVPFSRFDVAVIVLSLVTLLCWVLAARSTGEMAAPVGVLMCVAGIAHLLRQGRWCPERTGREPLLWILHLGYLFVPIGYLLTGAALLLGDVTLATEGTHAWTAGAIGIMTLAVLTRATRGHSGQILHAPWSTTWLIYACAIASAVARIAAAVLPIDASMLLSLAGVAWIMAFLNFTILYKPRGRLASDS